MGKHSYDYDIQYEYLYMRTTSGFDYTYRNLRYVGKHRAYVNYSLDWLNW